MNLSLTRSALLTRLAMLPLPVPQLHFLFILSRPSGMLNCIHFLVFTFAGLCIVSFLSGVSFLPNLLSSLLPPAFYLRKQLMIPFHRTLLNKQPQKQQINFAILLKALPSFPMVLLAFTLLCLKGNTPFSIFSTDRNSLRLCFILV